MDLRRDEAALSEIVGALMLVLIVVVAGTGLGMFVLHKQERVQEQQLFDAERSLERLHVEAVEPLLDASAGDRWGALNFTVQALHARSTFVHEFRVNGEPAKSYTLTRLNATTGAYEAALHAHDDVVRLEPRERFFVDVDLTTDLFSPATVLVTDAVRLEVLSAYQNRFERTFLPPTAIAQVVTQEQWNGTGFEPFVVLDGSLSDHPDGTGLVAWNWTIDEGTADEQNLTGRRVRADFPSSGIQHTLRLRVEDRFGMFATDDIVYFH